MVRNLGIALGAGANAALDAFGRTLRFSRDIDEMRQDAELRRAIQNAPRVGDVVPGQDGTPGTTVTQEMRERAIFEALQNTGSPRNLALAAQLRTAGLQAQRAEIETRRMRLADNALMANRLLAQGDAEGALGALVRAYDAIPDGNRAVVRREGGHFVMDILPQGDGARPIRSFRFDSAESIRPAVDAALMFSTPEMFAELSRRQWQSTENRLDRESRLQAARISAGAALGAARIGAESRLQAARISAETMAPVREAQVAHYRAQTENLLAGMTRDRQTEARIQEFSSLLGTDPFNPRLVQLRTEIMGLARDPSRWEVRVREFQDGVPTGEVIQNRLDRQIAEAQARLQRSVESVRRQLGQNPSPADLDAARRAFDAVWSAGMFDRYVGRDYHDRPAPTEPPPRQGQGGLPASRQSGAARLPQEQPARAGGLPLPPDRARLPVFQPGVAIPRVPQDRALPVAVQELRAIAGGRAPTAAQIQSVAEQFGVDPADLRAAYGGR